MDGWMDGGREGGRDGWMDGTPQIPHIGSLSLCTHRARLPNAGPDLWRSCHPVLSHATCMGHGRVDSFWRRGVLGHMELPSGSARIDAGALSKVVRIKDNSVSTRGALNLYWDTGPPLRNPVIKPLPHLRNPQS